MGFEVKSTFQIILETSKKLTPAKSLKMSEQLVEQANKLSELYKAEKWVSLRDVEQWQFNLEKLYDFVTQGSTQSSDDMAKSAFSTMKYRIGLLFPELVQK